MSNVTVINQELIDRINQLHREADSFAHKAVKCAKELGIILIEVKKKVGHGQFTAWIEQNIDVSPRQARRYINAALGRSEQIWITGKTDTVSVFNELPIFLPLPGFAYFLADENMTDVLAVVEWSKKFPAFFFVTVFSSTDTAETGFSYSPRPIEGIDVHDYLQFYGISDPKTGNWRYKPSDGVSFAGESLGQKPYLEIDRIVPLLSPRKLLGERVFIEKDDKKLLNPEAQIDLEEPYAELNLPEQVKEVYVNALLTSLTDPQPLNSSSSN